MALPDLPVCRAFVRQRPNRSATRTVTLLEARRGQRDAAAWLARQGSRLISNRESDNPHDRDGTYGPNGRQDPAARSVAIRQSGTNGRRGGLGQVAYDFAIEVSSQAVFKSYLDQFAALVADLDLEAVERLVSRLRRARAEGATVFIA